MSTFYWFFFSFPIDFIGLPRFCSYMGEKMANIFCSSIGLLATVSVDCPYLCHGSVDSTPAELRFLWPSSSFFCLCGSSSKQQLALPGFVCSAYCCPLHRVLYLYGSCAVSQNSIKLVLLISIVVSVISWEMEEFKLESFQSQAWIRIINKCNSFAFGVQTNFDLWVFALFDSLKQLKFNSFAIKFLEWFGLK